MPDPRTIEAQMPTVAKRAEAAIRYFEERGRVVVGVDFLDGSGFRLRFRPNSRLRAKIIRGRLTQKVKRKVYEEHGLVCAYCGTTRGTFHIDHVIPVSRGGTNSLGNLVVACAPCNFSKGNKLLDEWRQKK